ncbi:MAG: hypothetical protein RLZZ502_1309 [Pseudomonadota bacterium]|jgi:xanthine dehydrogenase large subunit
MSAVHQALAHESARLHVTGAATYTDDVPEAAGTLYAALGLSRIAHGDICTMDLSAVKAAANVVAVFVAGDFPGVNDCGPVVKDEPILADREVRYLGQPIFMVVAKDQLSARRAARLGNITYREKTAVLSAKEAHALQQYVCPPMHMQRGDVASGFASAAHQLSGEWSVGGQEQFYLEGQIAYAQRRDHDELLLYCSTQHPSEMQALVAHALGLSAHQVQVVCRRIGGGFGGKETQSGQFCCLAALAAWSLQSPVKLRLDRDDDMQITGKRHDFHYDYQVAFDAEGKILGLRANLLARAGHSADLSAAVMTRALCHLDNAYYLPAVEAHGFCCKTNTQSNTAFRGFGGPQGALLIEYLLDVIAAQLGINPLQVRLRNVYRGGQTTPYGQTVHDDALLPILQTFAERSDFANRWQAVAQFNQSSSTHKRGLGLSMVKFGISFNVVHLNQAGALVHVYQDGTVLVNHGAIEMGQGVNTKVAQVVAEVFGIALGQVRCTATDTQKVANTSATAASTGADLNAKAAQAAAQRIKQRLDAFALSTQRQYLNFAELVQAAYLQRVQLWSDGFYATPGLSWDAKQMQGQPFYYFAYGAACSEVEVDLCTGETKVLRVDIDHDVGASLNPAIDQGQIEGGFVQGMGWLLTEELVHNAQGKLTTHAPSTYKIPLARDVPKTLQVTLLTEPNSVNSIHHSKAVGEPPLLHAISTWLAVRQAVISHTPQAYLPAPATPEAVYWALHPPYAHIPHSPHSVHE